MTTFTAPLSQDELKVLLRHASYLVSNHSVYAVLRDAIYDSHEGLRQQHDQATREAASWKKAAQRFEKDYQRASKASDRLREDLSVARVEAGRARMALEKKNEELVDTRIQLFEERKARVSKPFDYATGLRGLRGPELFKTLQARIDAAHPLAKQLVQEIQSLEPMIRFREFDLLLLCDAAINRIVQALEFYTYDEDGGDIARRALGAAA